MSSIQEHTTQVLKSLKALAGEVIFHAALEAIQGNTIVATGPKIEVTPEPSATKAEPKKRRTNNISDEQRSERSHNMAALQAFTKAVKKELTDSGDPKEAKRVAGARWKAMSKEEKARWADEHLNTTEVAAVCAVCQDPIVDKDSHRECLREAVVEAKAEGKGEDEAIQKYVDASGENVVAITTLEPAKRGRGRPKGLGPAPGVNVRRLSKTETAALDEGPPGSVPTA